MPERDNQKINILILVLLIATILSRFARVLPFMAPYRSLIIGVALLFVFIFFPYRLLRDNDFDVKVHYLLGGIIIVTIIATIRSCLMPVPVHIGNKWLSLFGNEHCMYLMATPVFIYLGTYIGNVRKINKAVWLYLIACIWSFFVDGLFLLPVAWVAGVIFPYVNRQYRLLIIIALAESIYASFFRDGTVRTQIIVLAISFLSYYIPHRIQSLTFARIMCYTMFFVPLFYTSYTLISPGFSAIEVALSLFDGSHDTDLTADSRTFLFYEMESDLTKNDAWLFGKGAYSFYYSPYFSLAEGDSPYRIVSEVSILNLLMRGGIVYVILYYSIIFIAIRKALYYGNNKFVWSIAIMASGWTLVSCFSAELGTNFFHLCIFLLIGCCMSNEILDMSDEEITENIQIDS